MFARLQSMALICIALVSLSTSPGRATEVDVEIVLAVDASGSVNDAEFKLQLSGIAAAFRHPEIQQAILSGPRGRVAVALLVWSDSAFPKFATEWFVLNSRQSAVVFAGEAETFHHKTGRSQGIGGGGTAIGDAVAYAITMLDGNGIDAPRRVIDVSGDGVETPPWMGRAVTMPEAKLLAEARSIMINGLAILTDFAYLDKWYRDNVITGAGSFVIVANDFPAFKEAIHQKLWREFSSPVVQAPSPVKGPAKRTAELQFHR